MGQELEASENLNGSGRFTKQLDRLYGTNTSVGNNKRIISMTRSK